MNYHLTMVSNNTKTGRIPVSTTGAKSCPDACPLKSNGCYADQGHVAMWWQKVSRGDAGYSFKAFLAKVRTIKPGQLWRHNQAGDLPGVGDYVDAKQLAQLVEASAHTQPFTFTHVPVLGG